MNPLKRGLMLALPIVLLVASLAFAQGTAPIDSLSAFCQAGNKVGVQFMKNAPTVIAGTDFPIIGRLINFNKFPINNVSITAEVVKASQSSGSVYDMATDTVARFVPVNGLNIQASSTAHFSFKWHVPIDLPAGQYHINLFVVSSGQFPIVGMESTGLVTIAYPVSVVSNAKEVSYFDQSSVTVNSVKVPTGQAYVSGAGPETVSVNILNTHLKPQDDILVWRIYSSDIASDKSLVDAKTETVSMSPSKKATASISILKADSPVYYFIGELKDGDKSSFVTVRVARSDMSKPSFTMLGITPFPLKLGSAAVFFGCLAKSPPVNDSFQNISVSITGSDGSTVYYGKPSIGGTSVGGFFGNFLVPKSGWQTLRVIANVTDKSGSTTASSAISYSCNGSVCSQETPTVGSTMTAVYYLVGLSIVVVIFVILSVILVIRRRRAPEGGDLTDNV